MSKTVTIREVVDHLQISYDTVYTWRRGSSNRAPLPVYRRPKGAGVSVAICEQDLTNFLDTYRPDLLDRWRFRRDSY